MKPPIDKALGWFRRWFDDDGPEKPAAEETPRPATARKRRAPARSGGAGKVQLLRFDGLKDRLGAKWKQAAPRIDTIVQRSIRQYLADKADAATDCFCER